jgi:hypothetical protein
MFQRKNLAAPIGQLKVLFIGNESSASHVVCDFLHTAGCKCTVASGSESLAWIEQEFFSAVLVDVTKPQASHEQTILAIKEIRPALAKRILLITGPEPAERSEFLSLPQISIEKPLSQLWTKLEEILAVPRPSRLTPPGMQNARLIFDSFSVPAVAGIRGPLAAARQLTYQYDSATVNLLIHLEDKEKRISLVGQVLDVSMRAVHGLPVLLSDGNRPLAEATTSQFGEFRLQVDLMEYAGLQIRLAEGSWIHMPLENMDWKKPM